MALSANQTLQVVINAQNRTQKAFNSAASGLETLQDKATRVGKKMQSVGASMNQYVTLPLLAAGGAALKFSADFQDKANEVQSTANLTNEEIAKISTTVEDVASTTGVATDKIFDGMQKAVSGSLSVAQSQEFIADATKASAAGFGDVQDIVNVTTTAFDLFTDTANSTSEVLDQIVRAAQNTQVEASELASAFGRGASVAATLGLNQNELASILGVVSERMGDTQRGGRAVASMLRTLLKPSQEAEQNIAEIYGSFKNFRKELADNALGTLKDLKTQLNENGKGLQDVVQSGNALNAIQVLLSDNGERVEKVLAGQADAAGSVNDAFEKSDSFGRFMRKSMQKLMKALRPLGDVLQEQLKPAFETVLDIITRLSNSFSNASPTMQKMIVVIGGLVAAIGPLLTILGTLAIVFGALNASMIIITLTIAAIAGAVLLLIKYWPQIKKAAKPVIDWLVRAWQNAKDWISTALTNIANFFSKVWKKIEAGVQAFFNPIKQYILMNLQLWKAIFTGDLNTIKEIFAKIWGAIKVAFKAIWDAMQKIFSKAITYIGTYLKKKLNEYQQIWKAVWNVFATIFKNAWNGIKDFFKSIFDWIGDKIKKAIEWIEDLLDPLREIADFVGSNLKSFFNNISGGIEVVTRSTKSVNDAVISPNGDVISTHPDDYLIATKNPASLAGGSGVNITINGDVSGEEVVEKVKRGLMSQLNFDSKPGQL